MANIKKLVSLHLAILVLLAFIPLPEAMALTGLYEASDSGDATYHIQTAAQLAAIGGQQSVGKSYVLDNDIHLTEEWVPIEDFAGTFDGQGFAVNNLYVLESSERRYAGLFGTLSDNSAIQNLGVNIGAQGVHATLRAGGLAGYAGEATIANCCATGNVYAVALAYNYSIAGGLVGSSSGLLTNCRASGNVSAKSDGFNECVLYAGGLAGESFGTLESCYATGDVSAMGTALSFCSAYAGGLAGRSLKVTNCYATGNVSAIGAGATFASSYAGGLIGYASNTITNCYATGDVSASGTDPFAGGLIGTNDSFATSSHRLSTQTVTGINITTDGTALTPEQMRSQSSFIDWDFQTVWNFDPAVNSGFPILRMKPHSEPADPADPADDAIHIQTAAQLAAIGGEQSAGKHYVLNNDIHLTEEWVPIEDFRGHFDGQGYAVNNLYVQESSVRDRAGLFGWLYGSAVIQNLGVNIGGQGVHATGSVGGLAGEANGATLTNCYATGNVYAAEDTDNNAPLAGGLVGYSNGLLTNCRASGNVSAKSNGTAAYAGGLIGFSGGTLESCYATGDVSAMSTVASVYNVHAGGLAGLSHKVTNCYATGNVLIASTLHNSGAGGLVGLASDAVANSYATGDISASGTDTTAGGLIGRYSSDAYCYRLSTQTVSGTTINPSGTALTPEQMRSQTSFMDWDFQTVWDFDPAVNSGYPILRMAAQIDPTDPAPAEPGDETVYEDIEDDTYPDNPADEEYWNSPNDPTPPDYTDKRYTALVLDVSGSMQGEPIKQLKTAAMKFCDAVLAADGGGQIAVVAYSSRARVVSAFTRDKQKLYDAINGLRASGDTNMHAGLSLADGLMQAIPDNVGGEEDAALHTHISKSPLNAQDAYVQYNPGYVPYEINPANSTYIQIGDESYNLRIDKNIDAAAYAAAVKDMEAAANALNANPADSGLLSDFRAKALTFSELITDGINKGLAEAAGENTYAAFQTSITDNLEFSLRMADDTEFDFSLGCTGPYGAGHYFLHKFCGFGEQKAAESTAITKNVVLLSDGMPNKGTQSNTWKYDINDYKGYRHANAAFNLADGMKGRGNHIYALGFFHKYRNSALTFAKSFMEDMGDAGRYLDIPDANSLTFAFEDAADGVLYPPGAVVKIACPVDVTVDFDGEQLSSAAGQNNRTSWGRLKLSGVNRDIKTLNIYTKAPIAIDLQGTGTGTMDYAITFQGMEKQAILVPVNEQTRVTVYADKKDPLGPLYALLPDISQADSASSWAVNHIKEASLKGFLTDELRGSYQSPATRAEFVRLAMSWLRYKTGKTNEELLQERGLIRGIFSDTTDQDILTAAALGITSGVGGGRFGVNEPFDRQQAALMLTYVTRLFDEQFDKNIAAAPRYPFTDIDSAAAWAKDAIHYVKHRGIMDGTGVSTFDPKGMFSREMSITVFNRMG